MLHSTHSQETQDDRRAVSRRFSPAGIALVVFTAIALFFLVTEHRAHLYGALPYLLVLACPLMHLLHRHGHRGHHHASTSQRDGESQRESRGEQW